MPGSFAGVSYPFVISVLSNEWIGASWLVLMYECPGTSKVGGGVLEVEVNALGFAVFFPGFAVVSFFTSFLVFDL